MNAPVEFALAISSSSPSGTGSYTYEGSFKIVVQNLAYTKQVSIWTRVGGLWKDIDANYVASLPGGLELWSAPASNSETQFVAKYIVNGTTYWDNNDGWDYLFPQAFDEFVALAGRHYPVVLGSASLGAGTLHVDIGVQDLAFSKVVGIVLTTDDWATVQVAYGTWSRTMKSGLQVWHLTAPVGTAAEVKFAIFFRVLGTEIWDNNFWRNYRVTPSISATWGDAP